MDRFLSEEIYKDVPEEFPGILEYGDIQPSQYAKLEKLIPEDVAVMSSLGGLAPGLLLDEIQALHELAVKLEFELEQELRRGKLLDVLNL